MKKIGKKLSELKILSQASFLVIMFISISIIFTSCKSVSNTSKSGEPQLTVPKKSEHKIGKASMGTIKRTINGGGIIVSGIQQDLSFKIGGCYLKSINTSQGQTVKKGQVLAELESKDIENQLKEQEIKLKMAELDVEKLKASNANSYDLEKAQLEVQIQKIEAEKLKDKLSKTKLVSEINGVVTYMLSSRIGESVPQYKTFCTIADTEKLMIEYSGKYVDMLKMGMYVKVDYKGIVADCKVMSNPIKIVESSTLGTSRTVAYISANDLQKKAVIGDNVKLYMEIDKRENVLNVPLSAIHQFNNTFYVNVLENGTKVEKSVDVGITDNINVEIIKGLKEGEEVIID